MFNSISLVRMQVRDLVEQTFGHLSAAYAACGESCSQTVQTTLTYFLSISYTLSVPCILNQTFRTPLRDHFVRSCDFKLEDTRLGPRGYLAEYGEYVPPPKQHKKQRDVAVPVLTDVS